MRSNYFECCSRVNPSDSVPETLSNIIIYNKKQDDEIAKKANKDDLSEVAKSGLYYDLIDKPVALPNPKPITINGQRYDGSEAVTVTVSSGGGGGGTPVEIDDTLTQRGKAADAKAVGDQLSALNEANATQNTEIAKKANKDDLSEVAKSGRYYDLIDKPVALPNPKPITINGQRYDGSEAVTVTVSGEGGGTPVDIDDTLTQSGKAADAKVVGDKLSELNKAKANNADLASVAKSGSYNDLTNKPTIPTVPTTLPNPKKLKLTGAVTAEYDGSIEVSVEIPEGGGSAYELPIASETTLGGVKAVAATDDMTDNVGITAEGFLKVKPGGESDFVEVVNEKVTLDGTVEAVEFNIKTGVKSCVLCIDSRIDGAASSDKIRPTIDGHGVMNWFEPLNLTTSAYTGQTFYWPGVGSAPIVLGIRGGDANGLGMAFKMVRGNISVCYYLWGGRTGKLRIEVPAKTGEMKIECYAKY